MLNTQLILIEGIPGSGKSTTARLLGEALEKSRIAARWFDEEDPANPIAWQDYPLQGLTERVLPLWRSLVEQAQSIPGITILESRLWQNTALFMYMQDYSLEEIVGYHEVICQAILPLSPILIHLVEDNTEAALRRVFDQRGKEWEEWAYSLTDGYRWFQSRGGANFKQWVIFFEEWRGIADRLFELFPGEKIKIWNAHADWPLAHEKMQVFLEFRPNGVVRPDRGFPAIPARAGD